MEYLAEIKVLKEYPNPRTGEPMYAIRMRKFKAADDKEATGKGGNIALDETRFKFTAEVIGFKVFRLELIAEQMKTEV